MEVEYNFNDAGWVKTGKDKDDTIDKDALGLYADLGYTTGDFVFGVKGMYASGDDDATDGDSEAFMGARGLGNDFNPQQLMTGDYMSILNGDNPLSGIGIRPDVAAAGVMGFVGYVSYKVSPKLTLSADLGTYSAVEEAKGYDDDYGQEIGLGFAYKLYDNLTYGAHFSYMMTGDFFEHSYVVGEDSDGDLEWQSGSYHDDDTEDMYLLAHALVMKF